MEDGLLDKKLRSGNREGYAVCYTDFMQTMNHGRSMDEQARVETGTGRGSSSKGECDLNRRYGG